MVVTDDGAMLKKVLIVLFTVIAFTALSSRAQVPGKSSIFDRCDRLLEDLQKKNAALLSPQMYEKTLKMYKKASKDYDKENPDIQRVTKRLRECEELALQTLKNTDRAQSLLGFTLEIRNKALDAGAPQFASELWQKAEDKLKDAAEELEDDDVDDAKEEAQKASDYYTQARLESLKNNVLSEARNSLHLAREAQAEDLCPNTFNAAKDAIKETEGLIVENPDDLSAIRQKADEANYLARHALFLAKQIKTIRKSNENAEMLLLKFEDILSTIAEPFNYQPQFDRGFGKPVETIVAYIANLKKEQKRLMNENDSLKSALTTLQERESGISEALRKKMELEAKINKIKSLFAKDEAEVRVQDANLLIRLSGLKFAPGQAIIQPEYFSLLTKVQRAIHEFPQSYIVVQGHTDATGNAYKNKLLSEKRAQAVKEYLQANLSLDANQIQAIGMGDQKPIASNKTAEGRAKNRRIDIFIALPKEAAPSGQ